MAKKPPQIIALEEWDESINMLVYGDSGIGKTVLAGTCPNVLILGVEDGTISAKRQGSKGELWPINNWDDLNEAYSWLYDNPDHGYEWVVIDSITDMQEKDLRAILDAAVKENGNRDADIPAIQDHQKWQNSMKRMVNAFNDLPVNVLYTALEMRKEDEEGEDLIMPLLLGKDYGIAQSICGKMGVVARLGEKVTGKGDDRVVERRLLCQKMSPYFAKDRYGCLGRYVTITRGDDQINDMASIWKMILESGSARTTGVLDNPVEVPESMKPKPAAKATKATPDTPKPAKKVVAPARVAKGKLTIVSDDDDEEDKT